MERTSRWSGDDWDGALRLIDRLDATGRANVTIPSYFDEPLHGLKEGGNCIYQALYQSVSMRHVMRLFQLNDKYREQTIRRHLGAVEAPLVVLDFGCGSGDSTSAIAETHPASYVIGIDLSSFMIQLAKARYDAQFVVADAATTPFPANMADAIVSFAMFHEMPSSHSRAVLTEMTRVLRAGGTLLIWDQRITPFTSLQHLDDPIEPFMHSYSLLNITAELIERNMSVEEVSEGMFRLWKAAKRREDTVVDSPRPSPPPKKYERGPNERARVQS